MLATCISMSAESLFTLDTIRSEWRGVLNAGVHSSEYTLMWRLRQMVPVYSGVLIGGLHCIIISSYSGIALEWTP